jgi:hypothetical protein
MKKTKFLAVLLSFGLMGTLGIGAVKAADVSIIHDTGVSIDYWLNVTQNSV